MTEKQLKRFLPKFKINPDTGCWEWLATSREGYSMFSINSKNRGGHRVAYEHWKKPIPEGLVIDHLCRNTRCVNPDHLEPVTDKENILRGNAPGSTIARTGTCMRGHPRIAENMYTRPVKGTNKFKTRCRICHKAVCAAWYKAKKECAIAAS